MAALLGLLTALSWGTSDFAARFSSRAIGAMAAALGGSIVSALLMSAGLLWFGLAVPTDPAGLALAAASGVATGLALTLLYQGLRVGSVALAVTLASTYPVWALAVGVAAQGVRPSLAAWVAMAVTLAGVWIVSAADPHAGDDAGPEDAPARTPVPRGRLILIGLASGLCFALALKFAQPAVEALGQVPALWAARLTSSALLLVLLLASRRGVPRPGGWVWIVVLQGILDAAGYLSLLSVTEGVEAEVATVVSSAVGVVTILLAHVILREPVGRAQWGGIALTFAGVAALSALS